MNADVLIGIDAGTSVIKAAAFTRDGEQIGAAAIPNSYVRLPNGGVEQDMARTWQDAAAARDCYSAMGDIPQEVRITGGAARSKALRLMLASALKAGVRTVSREEAGAAGAAMMAAVQQKLYPDMAACASQWVDPLLGEITAPDAKLAKIHDAQFPLYKETREKMRPIWRSMLSHRREQAHAA